MKKRLKNLVHKQK